MNWKEGLKRREVAYGSLPIYSHFRLRHVVSRAGLAHVSRVGSNPITSWIHSCIKLLCVHVTTDFVINDWSEGGKEEHRAFAITTSDPLKFYEPRVKGIEIQLKPNLLSPGDVEKLLLKNEEEFFRARINYFDILDDGYLKLMRAPRNLKYISTPAIRNQARLRLGSLE